ncbi:invasion associated locus B family protein [Temperatibacter marinus]|uniref:Invasion associated locus B family protein n=1 Tax=Temperatibacter marinus TaxID=1456591 RepID=A0AA52H9D6_9PROT|nr:invasion associated locus B family protein [Temperatibacter marinus]WND03081.1 invasion associated locus B family protein [Temperatibacter marinus]
MSQIKLFTLSLLALVVAGIAPLVEAQDKRDTLGSFRKWDAMKMRDSGADMCYMISTPTRWSASRKGVRRGDIYFTVTSRPRFKIKNQINTVVGYTLKAGSEVTISIDGRKNFKLFTEGGGAWAYDPRDDQRLVTAMKAGNSMVVTATSSRGTRTTDVYSLSGFTAANNAINRRCK